MEKLDVVKRTVSAEVMGSVAKYLPRDAFKLTDEMLNKTYMVTNVEEIDFDDNAKSFIITAQDEQGNVINLSASSFKNSRVLKTAGVTGKMYQANKNILAKTDATEIWNGSTYVTGMKKDEEFVIPAAFKLRYAVLSEDRETGELALNPFLYKGFDVVANAYRTEGKFPRMSDFREELLKTDADGRIKGLHPAITVPTPQPWVKGEVSDYRHTLILEDFEN